MRPILGLLALALLVGCEPAPVVRTAPVPTPEQVDVVRRTQSRLLPISRAQVFPKVLNVLMDLGYQVRCADANLGQVNIFQTWQDQTRSDRPDFAFEATLLFEAAGPDTTRVRIAAFGRWDVLQANVHGSHNVSGTQPSVSSEDCGQFLDLLARNLCVETTVAK